MSDLLFNKNRHRCPKCFVHRQSDYMGKCSNCGMMLFTSMEQGWKPYWMEVSRNFWIWHNDYGWVFSSHAIDGFKKPNARVEEEEKLDENYGKDTTPEAVRGRGGKVKIKVGGK